MNFFKEQEIARKRLERFHILFMFTVMATATSSAIVLRVLMDKTTPFEQIFTRRLFLSSHFFWSILFFAAIIYGCSQWKRWLLGRGGSLVAESMGGVEISKCENDLDLEKLKNIVEEMSIASGIIPPKIFLLAEENDINAFAAGLTFHDAAIAVSKGCLKKLNRDELQGVVAHEIGHIVNGDMKLNLEIIGYLFGLMAISDLGKAIMRGRDRKKNPTLIIGLCFYVVGSLGYVMGLLLRYAISRNQEFAADARAVQFTRNPHGIGGALKKILAGLDDFKVEAPKGHEVSHMWLYFPRSTFFSSHPPLEERISRILQGFKAKEFFQKEKKSMREEHSSLIDQETGSSFVAKKSKINVVGTQEALIEKQAMDFFEDIASHSKLNREFNQQFIEEMNIILGRLRNLPLEKLKPLLEKLKSIIKADSRLTPRELLCFALFKETLLSQRASLKRDIKLQTIKKEILSLLSFLAKVSSDSPTDQKESFKAGVACLSFGPDLPMSTQLGTQDLLVAFEKCRNLAPLEKEKLLLSVDKAIETQKKFSFNSELIKKVLAEIMGVPHSEI